jgi:ethanolamine utilization protein EutQ (cupin superfamily)
LTARDEPKAWKLPKLGNVADEPLPYWLVSRLQSRDIDVTPLGGMSIQTDGGRLSCNAGDYVLLTEDNQISFCSAEEFTLT